MPPTTSMWRADIDGLRAVAVLAVVFYHALPSLLPGGFVGVDVFFVISGFLISGILLKEHQSNRFSFVRFYERRARRLFPALSVVLIVTVLASFLVSHPAQIVLTAKHSIASAFSLTNIVLWRESGYFDTGSRLKPLLNLWSLGVEEQFYLVWPLLLTLLVRRRALLVVIAIIGAASLTSAELLNESKRAAVFYLPFFRAWELGVGAALAIVVARGWSSDKFLREPAAEAAVAVGIGAILGSMIWLNERTPFPGLSALPAVVGSAAVLWAGTRPIRLTGPVSWALTSRPAVYIGLLSYSFYLWHWPLLSLPATAGLELGPISRIGIVIFAMVLAAATVRWIETPARLSSARARAAVLSCAALLASVVVAGFVHATESSRFKSPARRTLIGELDWPQPAEGRGACPAEILRMNPPLAYCRTSGPAPVHALIWGDSHADHLFAGVKAIDPHGSWMLLGHPSCPPTSGIAVAADQPNCGARAEEALRWIEGQSAIETVVMGFFGHYGDDTDVAQQHRDGVLGPSTISINHRYDRASKLAAFARGLEAAVSRLLQAGKRVVIVIDVPELPFAPADCFMPPRLELTTPRCAVARRDVLARQRTLREMLQGIASRHAGVRLIDPLPLFCGPVMCGAGTARMPLYRDSHHLSRAGSMQVARLILQSAL